MQDKIQSISVFRFYLRRLKEGETPYRARLYFLRKVSGRRNSTHAMSGLCSRQKFRLIRLIEDKVEM